MRLSDRQHNAITAALREAALPGDAEVHLFGSRIDDEAAGGDIDLLVVARNVDAYDLDRRIRRAFRSRVDERIDIIVLDPERPDPHVEAFVRTLRTERIA